MGKAQRDKGLRGELDVRHIFEAAGFTVRGLEGKGDNLIVCGETIVLHLEVKRQEIIKIDLWSKQAESEAPQGALPLVIYRRSRQPWRASLRLTDLLGLLCLAVGPDVVWLPNPGEIPIHTDTTDGHL